MNAEKFTKKSLEVVENCEKLAYEYNNQEIDQEHILFSLLTVEESLIAKLIEKMDILNACRLPCVEIRTIPKKANRMAKISCIDGIFFMQSAV